MKPDTLFTEQRKTDHYYATTRRTRDVIGGIIYTIDQVVSTYRIPSALSPPITSKQTKLSTGIRKRGQLFPPPPPSSQRSTAAVGASDDQFAEQCANIVRLQR